MSTHANNARSAGNELTIAGLETVYDRLATALDAAGDKSELFLVKLALLNANALGNPDTFIQQVDAALRDL